MHSSAAVMAILQGRHLDVQRRRPADLLSVSAASAARALYMHALVLLVL